MRIEALLIAAALGLAGCGMSRDNDLSDNRAAPPPDEATDVAAPPPPDSAIEEEAVDAPPRTKPVITASTGPLSAKDISDALANKTFAYSRGPASGTVSYFADGTFTYKEAGKGEGTGLWQASEGKLCEALDPADFLPKGTRSECHPFAAVDGAYRSGPKTWRPV